MNKPLFWLTCLVILALSLGLSAPAPASAGEAAGNATCNASTQIAFPQSLNPVNLSQAAPRLTFNPIFKPPDGPVDQGKMVIIGKGTIEISRAETYSAPHCTGETKTKGEIPFVIFRPIDGSWTRAYVQGNGILTWQEDADCRAASVIACVYRYWTMATVTIRGYFHGRGQCKIQINILEKYIQPELVFSYGPGCKSDRGWSIEPTLGKKNRDLSAQFVFANDAVDREYISFYEYEIPPKPGEPPYKVSQLLAGAIFLRDPEVHPSSGCVAGELIPHKKFKKFPPPP